MLGWMSPKLRVLLSVFGATLLLDQLSKLWVVRSLAYQGPRLDERARAGLDALGHARGNPLEHVVIPGWLSFEHAQNPAAAMGMMLGVEHRMVFFALFTVLAVAILAGMYRALAPLDRLQSASLAFLLAGVIGNAIDRVHKGTVTDFVKVTFDAEPLRGWMVAAIGSNEWYTFNIADAAIFVGLGNYLLTMVFTRDTDGGEVGAGPPTDLGETTA